MKQDKWTQQLHDKLAEHKVAAPEGLWGDIEAAINAQPQPRKARFMTLRRWIAAASVVCLVLGGSYWWLASDAPEVAYVRPVEGHRSKVEGQRSKVEGRRSKVEGQRSKVEGQRSKVEVRGARYEDSLDAPLGPQEHLPGQEPSTLDAHPSTLDAHPSTLDAHPSTLTPHPSTLNAQRSTLDARRSTLNAQPSPLTTIGIYASNGLADQSAVNGVLMADELLQNYNQTYDAGNMRLMKKKEVYLNGYEERQHHYLPISVGLSVSYRLRPRLSVNTGLVYTYMKSDFSQIINTQEIRQKQTLHYLGIPLNLSYQVYSRGRFKAYLSAGAEAD